MQRSLALAPPASPTLSVLSSGSPAVRRTERQRSLAFTPTHCVRCCPFFLAVRLRLTGKKGNVRWRSLLRLRLRLETYPSELESGGRSHATFAYAHSNSLRSLLSVLPCESPDGSSGKKATFTSFTPPASPTLSVLSSRLLCPHLNGHSLNSAT